MGRAKKNAGFELRNRCSATELHWPKLPAKNGLAMYERWHSVVLISTQFPARCSLVSAIRTGSSWLGDSNPTLLGLTTRASSSRRQRERGGTMLPSMTEASSFNSLPWIWVGRPIRQGGSACLCGNCAAQCDFMRLHDLDEVAQAEQPGYQCTYTCARRLDRAPRLGVTGAATTADHLHGPTGALKRPAREPRCRGNGFDCSFDFQVLTAPHTLRLRKSG